jgi:hypothetical protein
VEDASLPALDHRDILHDLTRELAVGAGAEREERRLAGLTATLRRGYFSQPGATEEGFQAALPELLEARRREAALTGDGAARRAQAESYRRAF